MKVNAKKFPEIFYWTQGNSVSKYALKEKHLSHKLYAIVTLNVIKTV